MTDRYDDKPLLRLYEFYVLWSIGELSTSQETTLSQLAPRLQAIYGVKGEWHDVIAALLGASSSLPAELRKLWGRNLEIAKENGATLTPQQFAEMIVDENFWPKED